MFSVASNFDDELPRRLNGLEADELFGACDATPLGHGRPRVVTPPVTWRQLDRHVRACRDAGIGFNLLLNPLCLEAKEGNTRLERRLRKTLTRAVDIGIGAVTVAHPWLVSLAGETPLRIRISVFVGIASVEVAQYWERLGAHVLALDTHVLSRDLTAIQRIGDGLTNAEVELPVNIGCLLRCPLARTHASRLSHSSKPGAQPIDPCVMWCLGQKRQDPVNLLRADFIRPEDVERYEAVGVKRFKIVDRTCSTDALVERVQAYSARMWEGDLLEIIGPKGSPPRRRRLPLFDGFRHLGFKKTLDAARNADQLMDTSMPWIVDNQSLDGLLLCSGCSGTGCSDCGHCARVAEVAVRRREVANA